MPLNISSGSLSAKGFGFSTQTYDRTNNSLRFRSSDKAYLSKTFASAGNRTTWTWSGWVKRGTISNNARTIIGAYSGGAFVFSAQDTLTFSDNGIDYLITTPVFRDASAWYHIVLVWDTTQATASNRIKIYINNLQVTSFSTSSYPAQNTTSSFNNNVLQTIGNIYHCKCF